MACKIDKRDIETALRVEIMKKYSNAVPTNFGHSVSMNVETDSFNKSEFNNFISAINKKYSEDKYGKILNVKQVDNLITVDFNISDQIVSAMEISNVKDTFNKLQDDHYTIFEAAPPKPATDNFVEFIRYQNNIIARNKRLIKNLKSDLKRKGSDKEAIKSTLRELYLDNNNREEHITNLSKNEEEYLFKALFEEIDNLNKEITNMSSNTDVKSRLEYLYKFIKGTSIDNTSNSDIDKSFMLANADYPELNISIDNLVRKYNETLENLAYKVISEDVTFYNNVLSKKDTFSQDDIFKMFHSTSDINVLEKSLLGLSSSSTNDTVLPSIIQSYMNTFSVKREAEVKLYSDRLRELINKLDTNDFNFIFEKNERGNLTGNLIDIYSEKWRTHLYEYIKINSEISSNEVKYKRKLAWLKSNSIVIDFRRISAVQEIYKDIYPEYFKFSEEETNQYETYLKDILGDLYEDEIEKVLENLESFELIKNENNSTEDIKDFERYLAQNNPYLFLEKYGTQSDNDTVSYKNSNGDIDETWSKINYIRFIPKVENIKTNPLTGEDIKTSTGFYNKDFKNNIANNSNKLEYWKLLKEIYTEYINPTYNENSVNDLSYAKIEKSFLEELRDTDGLNLKTKKSVQKALHSFKSIFYEQGYNSDLEGIRKNYQDNFKKQVRLLSNLYSNMSLDDVLKEAKKENINTGNLTKKTDIIKELASAKVISNYSMDINAITGALLNMTALHKARQDTAPIAKIIAEAHSLNNPDRKKSIERVNSWIDRVIYNKTEFERGTDSIIGRDFKISKLNWFKSLIEKALNLNFLKNLISEKFLKLLNNTEKEMFKLLLEQKQKGYKNSEKYTIRDTKDNLMYLKVGNSYFLKSNDKIVDISQEQFNTAFNKDIQDKIDSLGLDLNGAGLIQGMLKLIIFKSLAFAPVSGIFNRIEGFNSGYIMDSTGNYWTPGNYEKANSFMAFYNTLKIMPERMPLPDIKRVKELSKFKILLSNMSVIQDRKNELQRNSSFSKFDTEKLNPYQFAVELPEVHNQGTILLSVLMDTEISDVNGNTHKVFDKDTLEFTAYDEINGKLVLKDEFRTVENIKSWENFDVDLDKLENNSYLLARNKIKQAISRSQGNYDNLDVINITKSIWGRVFTLFLKWLPEHVMQRFASGDNFNIVTGTKGVKGRYRQIMSNKNNLLFTSFAKIFLAFGISPISIGLSLGISGLVVGSFFLKVYKGNKGIQTQTNIVKDLVNFLQTLIIQTLNYPLTLVRSKYNINSYKISEKIYGQNIREEEVRAMSAMCKELAVQLSWLVVIVLIKKALWRDKDDEEYNPDNIQIQNFLDNQVSRILQSVNMWSDPLALKDDVQRFALFRELENIQKFLSNVSKWEDSAKIEKSFIKVVPLPKLLKKGTNIIKDEKEFENNWVDTIVKDNITGGEHTAKKRFKKLKDKKTEELKKQLKKQGYKGKELEDELEKQKKIYLLRRKKGEKFKSVIQRMEAGETNPVKIKKNNNKNKKLKNKKHPISKNEI